MRARVELKRAGLRQILRSKAVSEGTRRAAEKIAARARDLAPVDTGAYRDSIGVDRTQRRDRSGHEVVARDRKAHWIEFGSEGRAPQRVLGRAADTRG